MAAGMYGLVGVFFSLIILAAALFACSALAHDAVLPFGLAEMVALIVSTSVYVVYKNVLAKRKKR